MNSPFVNFGDLIWILDLLCTFIAYSLGIQYTFSRWGLDRAKRLQMIAVFALLWLLCGLLLRQTGSGFLLAVLLVGLVFPAPYHRLRFLDGLGLWMPVGLCILMGSGTLLFPPSWPVFGAQILLLLGFLFLRQVYGPRFYRRFGQMYFLSLLLCGLGLAMIGQTVTGLVILAVAALGYAWTTFLEQPEEKPLLLFDLDGTLIDSQNLVFETFREVFRRRKPGYPLSEKELYSFFGPTLEKTFSRYFSEEEVPEVIDLYQQINKDLHPSLLRPMPHARETIEALFQAGYRMAIVSNKRRDPVLYGMELTGLSPWFEAVFAKEDQPLPKPAPDGLIHAASMLNTPLDQVIYVGDNAADIQAARNTAFFSTGYTLDRTQLLALQNEHPCRILKDLRQLQDIVKEDSLWIDRQIW